MGHAKRQTSRASGAKGAQGNDLFDALGLGPSDDKEAYATNLANDARPSEDDARQAAYAAAAAKDEEAGTPTAQVMLCTRTLCNGCCRVNVTSRGLFVERRKGNVRTLTPATTVDLNRTRSMPKRKEWEDVVVEICPECWEEDENTSPGDPERDEPFRPNSRKCSHSQGGDISSILNQ